MNQINGHYGRVRHQISLRSNNMCARYTLTKKEKNCLKPIRWSCRRPFIPILILPPHRMAWSLLPMNRILPRRCTLDLYPIGQIMLKWTFYPQCQKWGSGYKKTHAPLLKHHKTCLVLADGFYEWVIFYSSFKCHILISKTQSKGRFTHFL